MMMAVLYRNYLKLSSWLKPFGVNVCNFVIQKSSLSFSNRVFSVLLKSFFLNCSMNVNFACLLKLCPGSRKWASTGMELGFFASLQWLLMRSLAGVSYFPIYGLFSHFMHSSK